jgi:hypothetical protein
MYNCFDRFGELLGKVWGFDEADAKNTASGKWENFHRVERA